MDAGAGTPLRAWPLRTPERQAQLPFLPELLALRRSLLTILIVAALSAWISHGERAAGVSPGNEWVRTADGWESRRALELPEPSTPPPVHPAVIAAFQLGASLFFLLAFPTLAVVRPNAAPAVPAPVRRSVLASQAAAS